MLFRTPCPRLHISLLVSGVLLILAAAEEFQGECLEHKQCGPNEFCSAYMCAWSDVSYPCGKCLNCDECMCDSMSIDSFCPESCGLRRLSMNRFQRSLVSLSIAVLELANKCSGSHHDLHLCTEFCIDASHLAAIGCKLSRVSSID